MGVVYLGWDAVLERYVAVKRVRGPAEGVIDGGESWRAFREEAQLVARFRHPGIVSVFDFGMDERGVYIVTELIEGFDLERLVFTRGPCNELAAALLGYEVAAALHAAHSALITHRDVKPSNVMVDGGGRVLLMDFGIARRAVSGEDLGHTDVRGTPLYMAPELFSGVPASLHSDLWGLGSTLAWLLTGKPPVAAGSLAELGTRLRAEDWEPELAALLARGGDMASVVGTCLERDPSRRYTDAKALQAALGQVIQASLVPDPREELFRVAGEWAQEMGDAVSRVPDDPPSGEAGEAREDIAHALDETLDAAAPGVPVAATPHPGPSPDGAAPTASFGAAGPPGGPSTRPLRVLSPARVLVVALVVLVGAGAVAVAAWLLDMERLVDGSGDPDASMPAVSTMAPEERRVVAVWVSGEDCPPGQVEALAAAARGALDPWPESEVLGPAVLAGFLAGGPVTDARLLEVGRREGWRVLISGRCAPRDGLNASATLYDFRWDPPLRTGEDLQIREAEGDGTQLTQRWRQGIASRIWPLLPAGCEGPASVLPSREAARLLFRARALVPRYTREDLDEALRLVDLALEEAPDASDLHIGRAHMLTILVDRFAADRAFLDIALEEVAVVAASCPLHRRLHAVEAMVHALRGDSLIAIRILQEGLERYPTDPVSWNLLAVELGIVGRARDKVDALRRILGRDSADWNARINLGFTLRQLGSLDAAAAEYQQVVEGTASLDERLWAWDGLLWVALSRGDLALAGRLRDLLLAERVEHWTLESVAALAWFEGRCEETISAGERAVKKARGAWTAAQWTLLARLGDPTCGGRSAAALAAEALTDVAQSWPATGILFHGLLLDALGRDRAADKVLRGLGVDARSLAAEAAAIRACRQGNAATALAHLERALAGGIANAATTLRQRAWKVRILGVLGRCDEAEAVAKGCQDLVAAPDWWMVPGQPPRPEAWAAVLMLRAPARALALAESAVRLEPMDPEAWLALGLAARAAGDATREAEAKRRYRVLNPAPEWMEVACGAIAFRSLRLLAEEWR